MPTYQIDGSIFQSNTELTSDELNQLAGGNTNQSNQPNSFDQASSALDNINKTSQNINSNPLQDISGDLARGALNSAAGTIDKINGVAKLLNNLTSIDIGSKDLSNISSALKQTASEQPQSSNSVVSGIGQFIGSVPDALAEFAGSGGGVGFIARNVALSAADSYNKEQTANSLVKGSVVGATVGAALNAIPGLIDSTSKMVKQWGETAGKTYFQKVTGASNEEAEQFIRDINQIDLNPRNEVSDYNDAKANASTEVSNLRSSNNDIIAQKKEQNSEEYLIAKEASSKAMQDLSRGNDSIIQDLKDSQTQDKINLVRSNSNNLMASNDAATQRLADATTEQIKNVSNAKSALSNDITATFLIATKKLEEMQQGVTDNINMAHAALEKNGISYVQTPILQYELDNAIARNTGKFFKTINSGDGRNLIVSGSEGTRTPAVMGSLNLINSVRTNLVNDFLKNGKTSLSAIEANQALLEGAISRGFKGEALPKNLADILSQIKKSINPTKLYDKYPSELSHLKPLADANKAYSGQIDNMRNALNLYKDNVDGSINPDKVFKALDRGDAGYIAQLKQADMAMPVADRIFDKVKNSYDNFKSVEQSEKFNLTKIGKQISEQRNALRSKFDDMEQKLSINQRKEMSQIRTGNSYAERDLSNKQKKSLADIHYNQKQSLNSIKLQKDKELETLQKSLNDRLKFLHIQSMARGARANPSGVMRQVGNVATYRTMNGMMTGNPVDILQGLVMNKFASPIKVSNLIKDAVNSPDKARSAKRVANNKLLKALVATKASGR